MSRRSGISAVVWGVAVVLMIVASVGAELPTTMRALVEADYLRQAEVLVSPRKTRGGPAHVKTFQDAAGAVDGVKNGKYAFHTAQETNPWWQVDLGKPTEIARIVVYNRLDYAPGLHNADRVVILTSDDGKAWTERYRNAHHFGGITGAPPLEVRFERGKVRARFVRLQVPSTAPIYFHLDEVEV